MTARATPRGFVLRELGATIAVFGLVIAVLLAAGARSRRLPRLGDDIAKLRDVGAATGSYAADHQDLIWSFSWKGGVMYNTPYPDLNFASTDTQAQANQAIYILRTHGEVPDAQPLSPWIANIRYSHFTLAVHQGRPLPDLGLISSADKQRITWSRDPNGTQPGSPCGMFSYPQCLVHARGASFELVVCAYDGSSPPDRVSPLTNAAYSVPSAVQLGGRPLAEIAFPSQKVLVADTFARHFDRCAPYALLDGARLPVLFGDGAVRVRAASDANPGWQPNNPASPDPVSFSFVPPPGDPCYPTQIAVGAGRFRWTRGTATHNGLAGRDFGGPETCSGQPGCP